MDEVKRRLRCACGWEAHGTEEQLIVAAREHGGRIHNMLPTRDEVLAMIVVDDEPAAGSRPGVVRPDS